LESFVIVATEITEKVGDFGSSFSSPEEHHPFSAV
jgi:hypothetical protein